jgi:hypothetical protein
MEQSRALRELAVRRRRPASLRWGRSRARSHVLCARGWRDSSTVGRWNAPASGQGHGTREVPARVSERPQRSSMRQRDARAHPAGESESPNRGSRGVRGGSVRHSGACPTPSQARRWSPRASARPGARTGALEMVAPEHRLSRPLVRHPALAKCGTAPISGRRRRIPIYLFYSRLGKLLCDRRGEARGGSMATATGGVQIPWRRSARVPIRLQ